MLMPRRRTIYVDEMQLLARISNYADEYRCRHKQNAQIGVKYDLPAFAGRQLTPSERIRHQEAIRRLEGRRLVRLYGGRASRLEITKRGREAMAAGKSHYK